MVNDVSRLMIDAEGAGVSSRVSRRSTSCQRWVAKSSHWTDSRIQKEQLRSVYSLSIV